jgi:N-acetylglutamate synthase-like GNAT family acetyltransferase
MAIREFATTDQAGVTQLQAEFMQEFFPEFADDPRQYEWNADIYDLNEYYILKGGKFWVVEDNQAIVGVGGFRLVSPEVAEIKRIRIKAGCRGRGYGKAIVHLIEADCIDRGILRILVDTDERLATAKAMYEHMGYSITRKETVAEGNREYINYYFEKVLSPSVSG